ncbi:Hypothetical predicted protein [Mytilus galloprovincialis]|uniref:Uncharacterized protein n=1 Tax=Mytilus galloprovincialis TaxID=29158 RepID=A0A8B6FRQ5_MYTGA|nr:Hypothetical predicted protein [Mytilus galloprovincialis]
MVQYKKQAKVTGSTLYKAIGLENLSSMRDHFDNVICNLKEAPKNQFSISAMQHGTDNEINAVPTLVVRKISKPNGEEGSAETVSLEEVIPDSVLSVDPFNESSDEEDSRPGNMNAVLKHITLDDEAVAEIATCPIDNEAWTNELLYISDKPLGQQRKFVTSE